MSVCFTRCDIILLCYDAFRAIMPVNWEVLEQTLLVAHFLYNTSLHFALQYPGVVAYPYPTHSCLCAIVLHHSSSIRSLHYVLASLTG